MRCAVSQLPFCDPVFLELGMMNEELSSGLVSSEFLAPNSKL